MDAVGRFQSDKHAVFKGWLLALFFILLFRLVLTSSFLIYYLITPVEDGLAMWQIIFASDLFGAPIKVVVWVILDLGSLLLPIVLSVWLLKEYLQRRRSLVRSLIAAAILELCVSFAVVLYRHQVLGFETSSFTGSAGVVVFVGVIQFLSTNRRARSVFVA
jgi:hypothetical protein